MSLGPGTYNVMVTNYSDQTKTIIFGSIPLDFKELETKLIPLLVETKEELKPIIQKVKVRKLERIIWA